MLKLGTKDIKGLYLGDKEIKKAYLGEKVVFEAGNPSRLPAGYTEVEYITTAYRNCFETGFSVNSKTDRIEITVAPRIAQTAGYSSFAFNTDNIGSYCLYLKFAYSSSTNIAITAIANSTTFSSITSTMTILNTKKRTCIFDFPNKSIDLGENITKPTSGINNSTSRNFGNLVLGISTSVTSTSKNQSMIGKYYSFKVIRGGSEVLDLVPCTNSSGTPGFYDLVSGKFISNTGSGTPTAGPAV